MERKRDRVTGGRKINSDSFHRGDEHNDSSERMMIRRDWGVEVRYTQRTEDL